MNSALIISHSEKTAVSLTEVLTETSLTNITTISNAGEARRMVIDNDFDLYIVNAPLSDEFGENLAIDLSEKETGQVILLVRAELFDQVSEKVEECGIMTIAKPISRPMFWSALKLASATHKKINAMQKQNKKLIQKIEDIRIVDRAKCMLISYLSMSEQEAHRYIEKQAMDMRTTRRKVAEEILNEYQ